MADPKDTQKDAAATEEGPKNTGSRASTRKAGERHQVAASAPDLTPVSPAGRDDVAYPGRARRNDPDRDEEKGRRSGAKVLNSSVVVRNPETGEVETLEAGTEPPAWATEKRVLGQDALGNDVEGPLVGEHCLGVDPADTQVDPSVDVPVPVDRENEVPAQNAGRARWAAYASAYGVICHRGATKEDIIDALEAAGVKTS